MQSALFHDDVNDALRAAIKALGGTKDVAVKLWPEKTMADAQSYLNDCLNIHRPAKLSPEQVLLILRWSRDVGFHEAINYICDQSGYERPAPVEAETELAKLLREYSSAVKVLQAITPKIELAQTKLKIATG